MNRAVLDDDAVTEALTELSAGWTFTSGELRRHWMFPSFDDAIRFVEGMAEAARRLDHHPDLTLSWRTVGLVLSTHSAGGVTALDLELAAALDAVAAPLLAS